MKNVIFAISGPSGVGKGTLVHLLTTEDPSLVTSVSCTTRMPRIGEQDGTDYFFLSKEEFLSRKEAGDFLEYDEHFGNCYGTPRSFVWEQLKQKSVILEIDVVGALKVKEALKDSDQRIVLIMIVPPNLEELEQRLEGRGSENEEERKNRLTRVRYELAQQDKYDYTVVNDDLQSTKRKLQEIIFTERNKDLLIKVK